jgi:predicted CopG family antitoxin
MVAGLSDTVGYGLEDRAMKYLPELLKNRFNINLKTPLIRKYVTYNGEEEELNIYGKGEKDGKEIDIIGEAKSRPSKKDVEKFLKKINRLEKMKIISDSKFLLIVGYTIKPEVELYARKNNIEIIWSYEVQ